MSHIERRKQIINKIADTILKIDGKQFNSETLIMDVCIETGCSKKKAEEYIEAAKYQNLRKILEEHHEEEGSAGIL